MKKYLITALTLGLFGLAVSKMTVVALGTTWTLRNETDQAITLSCDREPNAQAQGVRMESIQLPAHQSSVYRWGELLANEGLGLGKGHWVCAAQGSNLPPKIAGDFVTSEGENAFLVLTGNEAAFKVTKGTDASRIASGHESAGTKEIR